jgi:hypothetical protein
LMTSFLRLYCCDSFHFLQAQRHKHPQHPYLLSVLKA